MQSDIHKIDHATAHRYHFSLFPLEREFVHPRDKRTSPRFASAAKHPEIYSREPVTLSILAHSRNQARVRASDMAGGAPVYEIPEGDI